MGKLHTLRRAIERDPHRWMWWRGKWCGKPFDLDTPKPYGAQFYYKAWHPGYNQFTNKSPYRRFVGCVLGSLGYLK